MNHQPRRVCVVVTARPSYSRVRTLLEAVQEHPDLDLQMVVAASAILDRYGRVEEQIVHDGFQVDARVQMVLEGETPASMAKTTGLGILELATVFDNLRPHVVVSVADRFETMSTAIAATYSGIPLAHIQGGEVTGSIDERVRHAVTKLADLHFPSTNDAAERIVRMGERPETVHVTGCPSIDLAARVSIGDCLSFDPIEDFGGVGPSLDISTGYVIVMQHPVTTEYHEAKQQVEQVLSAVMDSPLPALWFWPNVDAGADGTSKGIRAFRERYPDAPIHFFKNLPPDEFIELLAHAKAIVGNSSVGIREAAFLGTPTVNIGSRQEGRERGPNVWDVPCEATDIQSAIREQIAHGRYEPMPIYGDGDAGKRIADILATAPLTTEKRIAY